MGHGVCHGYRSWGDRFHNQSCTTACKSYWIVAFSGAKERMLVKNAQLLLSFHWLHRLTRLWYNLGKYCKRNVIIGHRYVKLPTIKHNTKKSTLPPPLSCRLRNSVKRTEGFTIVELLIVIVVITLESIKSVALGSTIYIRHFFKDIIKIPDRPLGIIEANLFHS